MTEGDTFLHKTWTKPPTTPHPNTHAHTHQRLGHKYDLSKFLLRETRLSSGTIRHTTLKPTQEHEQYNGRPDDIFREVFLYQPITPEKADLLRQLHAALSS